VTTSLRCELEGVFPILDLLSITNVPISFPGSDFSQFGLRSPALSITGPRSGRYEECDCELLVKTYFEGPLSGWP
jgi:hypothetical protein